MVSVSVLALFAAATCLALSAAAAGPPRNGLVPYVVVGDEIPMSLTRAKGDPVRGRAIVANHQVGMCLLCHAGPFPEDKFQGNIGPDLTGVGSRLNEGQLRLRIVDTRIIDPLTIMPSFYRIDGLYRVPPAYQGKAVLTAVEIEDVVAYLKTLK